MLSWTGTGNAALPAADKTSKGISVKWAAVLTAMAGLRAKILDALAVKTVVTDSWQKSDLVHP